MYYLFRLATIVIPKLPPRILGVLGGMIGLLAWLVARKARRQATTNIIHVLGRDTLKTRTGRRRLRRTVRAMFQHNARNYLEVFSLPHIPPEKIVRSIQVAGVEHLEAALALGKGVILFSAHYGPFDYLVQWAAIKGYQVVVPVEQLKDSRLLDLMITLRQSHGMQLIPVTGSTAMRAVIQNLRRNQIVAIIADRAITGQSVEKTFFDAPARMATGPVILAQRTGAALVGASGRRTADGGYQGQLMPLSLELTDEQRTNFDTLMDGVIKQMEQIISTHPEQWVAFSPIWEKG